MFSSYGFRYFVIFFDAHTKHIWYCTLVAKSDVFPLFKHLLSVSFHLKLNLFKLIRVVNIVS